MKKFLNIRALLAASVFGLSLCIIAAPASAQSTATVSNPSNPTSSCGTVGCMGTSTVSAMGTSIFGGLLLGSFGTRDADGNVVTGPGITGTAKGEITGGGDNKVTVDYSGCAMITCGNTSITAKIMGYEMGHVTVTGATTTPGQTLALANSGTLAAGASFTTTWPNAVTTTAPATHP